MKPMLATDADLDKLPSTPYIIQPKIDGVRGLNMYGELTGRSLKKHRNKYTTSFYSHSSLIGLDGELAAERETHPDLCRITSSALSTITGEPYTLWWLFDYVVNETRFERYDVRYNLLQKRVAQLYNECPVIWHHLRVVPMVICETSEQLFAQENQWLEEGYEGVIIRGIDKPHKAGRSTVREGGLLRIKRFIESEALITKIVEGEENTNVAQVNELGRQFRSSHKDGKIPNGLVGSFEGIACETVIDQFTKKVVIENGQTITISPGNMSHADRKRIFENQGLALGKVCKYKFFPKGIKDKPRFPTFMSFKMESDI